MRELVLLFGVDIFCVSKSWTQGLKVDVSPAVWYVTACSACNDTLGADMLRHVCYGMCVTACALRHVRHKHTQTSRIAAV